MWTPRLLTCLFTSPLLHEASYHPLRMKASCHLSSGAHPLASAQGHLSPSDQPPSASSPSHQPLHVAILLLSPKETILSSILPPTFCCISHLPSLEKALHTGSLLPHLPLPPRLCCLDSTLTSLGGMSDQGQPCCQIQWQLLTFPLLFPETSPLPSWLF